MITKKILTSLFVFCLLFSASFSWAQVSVGGFPMSQLAGVKSVEEVPVVTMRSVDVARLVAEDSINDALPMPWRFGDNIEVDIDPRKQGKIEYLADGTLLWRLAIESPGAHHMNLTFDDFQLPEGAKMYIFNDGFTNVIGGFTNQNNQADGKFATTLLRGEKIFIEYSTPPSISPKNAPHLPFRLTRVTHGYRNVFKTTDAFGSSGSCNNNANCPAAAAWSCQKRSVVQLVTGGSGFCTGTVINNMNQDQTPYVLTANHCYSNPSTWVFWFNWEAAGCANPASSPAYQSLSGATLKARRANSDFCLVQINSAIPANYNASYAGWDATGNVPQSGACIHHPSGDIKKISFVTQPMVSSTYAVLTTNFGWRAFWSASNGSSLGITEPGSSGSGIWDQNQRLVGQLYGGPSSCTAVDKSDYYGKISASWLNGTGSTDQLKTWLDPNNTGTLTLDGLGCRDFVLALNRSTDTICGSGGATSRQYTLGSTNFGGFTGTLALSATNVPTGVTVNLSANTMTSGNSVNVTVNVPAATPNGTYNITLSGNDGSNTRTTTLTLLVYSLPTATTLTAPVNGNANVAVVNSIFTWAAAAGASGYDIEIANDSAFTSIFKTATTVTATYTHATPTMIAGTVYYWRVRAKNPCGTGNYADGRIFQTTGVLMPTEIPTAFGFYQADTSMTDAQGWTHYIKRGLTAPVTRRNVLILSVKTPPSTLTSNMVSTTVTQVGGAVSPNYASGYMRAPQTWFVANRFWRTNATVNLDNLPVRFYMMTVDKDSLTARVNGATDKFSGYKFTSTATTVTPLPSSHQGARLSNVRLQANPVIAAFNTHWSIESTVSELNGFGGIGVGGDGMLNIDWISFTGQRVKNANLLEWKTGTEINNEYFTLEHSKDAVNFRQIARVASKGNGSVQLNYDYTDAKSLAKTHYYRLKQTDRDGRSTYAPNIVRIDVADQSNYAVYPNPAINNLNVNVLADNEIVTYQLFNAVGQLVWEKTENSNLGLTIDLSNLAKGVYVLTMKSNSLDEKVKITKID